MSEEIKTILEEMRFKAGIYRDHKKRGLSFNDEEKNCALLLDYIQQKENIIKELEIWLSDKYYGKNGHMDSDVIGIEDVLNYINELKGVDKE